MSAKRAQSARTRLDDAVLDMDSADWTHTWTHARAMLRLKATGASETSCLSSEPRLAVRSVIQNLRGNTAFALVLWE